MQKHFVNDDQVGRREFRLFKWNHFVKAYCSRKYLPANQGLMNGNIPSRVQEHKKLEMVNESQIANSSTAMPVPRESHHKSVNESRLNNQNK